MEMLTLVKKDLKMVLPLQLLSGDILVRPLVLIPVGASVSLCSLSSYNRTQ